MSGTGAAPDRLAPAPRAGARTRRRRVSRFVLSRRRFAGALGTALGGALAVPARAGAAMQPTAAASAGALVDLSSNENPYGPSPAALEAMARSCASAAAR